jgi:hypothetical protein
MGLYDDLLYWYKAKCHIVYDGDTFTQASTFLGLRHVHEKDRFRLWGIQANEIRGKDRTPEYKERADKAKARLRELTRGTVLFRTFRASKTNEVDKYGKYGRWLCTVYIPLHELREIGSPLLEEIEQYSDAMPILVDGRPLIKEIGIHKIVNVNLLLVAEGLADIKYY